MNHKIHVSPIGDTLMCIETLRPKKSFNIKIEVYIDPQHDGRCWPNTYIEEHEKELVEKILDDLRPIVSSKVIEIDPYSVHADQPKPKINWFVAGLKSIFS